jgi:hypothetical protein
LADLDFLYDLSTIAIDDEAAKVFRMEEWSLQAADDCLAQHGFVVDGQGSRILARDRLGPSARKRDLGEDGEERVRRKWTFLAYGGDFGILSCSPATPS